MNLKTVLPVLLPLATRWAKREAGKIQSHGVALNDRETELAKRVGVAYPEKVRVLLVPQLPDPDCMLLRMAARHVNGRISNAHGMALGHSIYICERYMSIRLLSHELRHVHQCEQYASVDNFLGAYLRQVVEYGYINCPFEVDARRNELASNEESY